MIDLSKFKKLFIAGIELKELYAGKKYTNQVPISTDTDGSIFNGVGYQENVRLSSSGGISSSAQTGSVTTGFIPWYGDSTVLRIKGVDWLNAPSKASGHYYIVFYDANKKANSVNAYSGLIEAPPTSVKHILTITRDANGVETLVFNKDYGTSNELLQWVRSASFIRIAAYGKGADMIVTINEEIGTQQVLLWKGVSYTNQIPISTDANGNIYNGKGWNDATYDNNGNVGDNNTTDLTGFIPCKAGDVIRLKNMPFNSTVAQCRLTLYTSDKSFIDQYLASSTWYMDTVFKGVKDSSGNYIQWTMQNLSGTVGFMRITAISITADSVVTINEEID